MKTVLVTGSEGFIGKNLRETLQRRTDLRIVCFDINDKPESLLEMLAQADIIYHLAGVNRPESPDEFQTGNSGLTSLICERLTRLGRSVPLIITSSTQASMDNPYGVSKKSAEDKVFDYGKVSGAPVYVYRLTNVFGKWSRPNYNSVVSTFCYNIARGLDITISNRDNVVELVYIDDVIDELVAVLDGGTASSDSFKSIATSFRITLGDLAEQIYELHNIRHTHIVPDLASEFVKKLHATYLSYLPVDDFSYGLKINVDQRGELAELIKSKQFGQMFISRSHQSVLRGNHYHNSKIEKFCVLQGDAVIRFRQIFSDEIIEYRVSGDKWAIIDIPPGYTHNIENLGEGELITLFWANSIFDPDVPDTYFLKV